MRALGYLLAFAGPLVVIIVIAFRVRNPDRIKVEFLKLGSVEISRSTPDDLPQPSQPSSSV